MKKKFIVFALLSFLIFVAASCDNDIPVIENNTYNKTNTFNIWKFPDKQVFKYHPDVKRNVQFFEKRGFAQKNTGNGFYIEEGEVQVIFNEGNTQYIFSAEREAPTPDVLENYVVVKYDTGEKKQYLISYPFTEDGNGIVKFNSKKVTIQQIGDDEVLSGFFGRSTCVLELADNYYTETCVSYPCSGSGHVDGDDSCECGVSVNCTPAHTVCTTYDVYVFETVCYGSGGGGGGGGGTGGGSGTPPTIITVPLLTLDRNCDELAKTSQSQSFKNNMGTLKNNITGTVEKGFNTYDFTKAPTPGDATVCGPIIDGTDQGINYGSANYFQKAISHNHLKDAVYNHIGTFSPNDILNLSSINVVSEMPASPITQSQMASYLVCNEGNYALKINDSNKLYNFTVKYNNDKQFRKAVDKFYLDNNITHGIEKQLQNIGFLKLIQKYDIGIDIYEGDGNFEKWKKMKLNVSEQIVYEQPC